MEKEAYYVKKESEMAERLKSIQEENAELERLKTIFESERTKAVEDLIKIERKLDAEV